MKKTIIANKGIGSQGKSSTIKIIANKIKENYSTADFNYLIKKGDIKLVITIDKIKIGIESEGDPGGRLAESLDYFAEIKCDIIICSCRTSGQTMWDVEDMKPEYSYDIIWVSNYRSNDVNRDNLNDLSADHIFELIKKILSNKI